jgi:hypothetical protein
MRVTRRDSLGRIEVVRGDAAPSAGAIAARETPEGYLLIEGRINGCGVYEYEDSAGDRWGELRLPEHVGEPETVESWDGRVPTDDHPPVWLDATNTRLYQRGTITRPRFASDGFTYARILITDAETIGKIREGKSELSCGYGCELVAQSGALDGQRYDYVQTKIRGNHVAIVDKARGGPMCALIFDAAGHRMERQMTQDTDKKGPEAATGNAPPKKRDGMIVIGETEYEVPDEVAAEFEALMAKARESGSMQDAPPTQPADSLEVKRLRAQLERERGRTDVLEGQVRKITAAEESRELDSLRQRATAMTGKPVDLKLDADGVRKSVLASVNPALTLDGRSSVYLEAAFDQAESMIRRELAAGVLAVNSDSAGIGAAPVYSLDEAATKRAAKIAALKAGG